VALLELTQPVALELLPREQHAEPATCTCAEGQPARVDVMGVQIDPVDMDRAVQRCVAMSRCVRPHTTLAINAAKILTLQDHGDDPHINADADLVFADGAAVVWAGRALGADLPERVAGIDLFDRLLGEAERQGLRCYFLGARPEVMAELKQTLRARFPELKIVGARDGYWQDGEEHGVVEGIRATRPDMLFLALPSPKKEIFTDRYRDELGAGLVMGVGGSFDVLAGHVTRAPAWMQQCGLEWLHRLACEPKKMWRRYVLGNPQFVWRLAVTKVRAGSRDRQREVSISVA
jgi:N-acetylglucosaminyldiphosphoundecaprenol N-acetyl-beta-D-mannosaminyltransferase